MAKAATMVTSEARARLWRRRQRRAVGYHPVVVVHGSGKDIIAAAAIDRRCSQR